MKQNYYHDLFAKHCKDIKKTWEIMRSIIKKKNDKTSISDTFKINDQESSNPNEITNGFCNYFTNIGSDLSKKIPAPTKTYDNYMINETPINSLFLPPCDDNEVGTIIQLLKGKKSSGHDGISSWLIKQLREQLCYPISLVINKSIEEGIFPDMLKMAKIIPIYKAKEKDSFSNHRPISLLSSISKIYEKNIYKRLYKYIEPFLYPRQFGFRSKRSTTQAVIELNADIIESYENKDITLATFLDLSKAFDTIDHNIILYKLERYGIRGTPLGWFRSYLTNKPQYVMYTNIASTTSLMTTGVP